jgi:HEAT repeat protein
MRPASGPAARRQARADTICAGARFAEEHSVNDVSGAGPAGLGEVSSSIRIALYDTGGESVEGGFVDRWVPNAHVACEELETVFERDGFLPEYQAHLREALYAEGVPHAAAAQLLIWLKAYTRPLIEELLQADRPHVRAIGVAAAAAVLPADRWLPAVHDASPQVRLAAVRAISEHSRAVPDADVFLLQALGDPDARVSQAAAERVQFYRKPQIGAALVQHLAHEPRKAVRTALLLNMATELRRAGIHVQGAKLEEGLGAPVRAVLLRELDNDDAEVRQAIASALERLRGEEVAGRMLERLLAEQHYDVVAQLLMFNGYGAVAERALPVLVGLLRSPTTMFRVRAAFLLEHFGPAAVPFLLQVLDDPDVGVRRAAAMSLGHMADVRALALLTREYANPDMAFARRELESAISAVTTRPPPALTPAERELLAAQITRQIDALRPTALGDWTLRVCKEELHALPVLGNQIYLWALRPDGTVLCMDHEAFTHPSELETDPLTCFAVAVAAARSTPELSALIPACPQRARPCRTCSASGVESQPDGSSVSCLTCGGRGWHTQ